MENAGTSYQSPSLIAAGASAQGVAMLTALINLFLSLVCLNAPSILDRIGVTKKGIILLSRISMLTWVPLILLFILPLNFKPSPLVITVMWMLSLAPAVLLSILRDSWLANLIPSDEMGSYLGERLALTGIFYIGTFLSMGYVLDNATWQLSNSFAVIFGISLIGSTVAMYVYSHMHDTQPAIKASTPGLKFRDYINDLKDKKLSRFIIFVSSFNLASSICGPLYAVYMIKLLGFSYSAFAIVLAAEYIARVTSVHFWGRLADRIGNVRVIGIVTRVIPLVPVLWILSPNLIYLVLVQALSGMCWAAFDLSNQGYIFKVTPQPKKLHFVVYNRSITLMSMALGGLLGVSLLGRIPAIMGNEIFSIFVISGILRAAVALVMDNKLVDYGLPLSRNRKASAADQATPSGNISQQQGLIYHPEEWGSFAMAVSPPRRKTASPPAKPMNSSRGLIYHPEQWPNYSDRSRGQKNVTGARKGTTPIATEKAMIYHPEKWKSFSREAPQPGNKIQAPPTAARGYNRYSAALRKQTGLKLKPATHDSRIK
jgi:MFS family permease